jgi:hypothetical protein
VTATWERVASWEPEGAVWAPGPDSWDQVTAPLNLRPRSHRRPRRRRRRVVSGLAVITVAGAAFTSAHYAGVVIVRVTITQYRPGPSSPPTPAPPSPAAQGGGGQAG